MHTRSIASPLLVLFSSLVTAACGPSLATMHEGAKVGRVQNDAPLHARRSIVIDAPREQVYGLVADVAGWPAWQANVKRVTPPSAVRAGERFQWVNGDSTISSQLARVEEGSLIAWTGSVSVAKAVHIWRFSSPTPGTTRVEVEETMDGFLLTWFYKQAQLDAEVTRSLTALARAAEARE